MLIAAVHTLTGAVRRSGNELAFYHVRPFRSSERRRMCVCTTSYKHATPSGVKEVICSKPLKRLSTSQIVSEPG